MKYITLTEDEQKYALGSIPKILPSALFELLIAIKVLRTKKDLLSIFFRFPNDKVIFVLGVVLRIILDLFKKIMLRRFYKMNEVKEK